jgi:hypothetical protein
MNDGRRIDPKDFRPARHRLAAIRNTVFDLNENPPNNAALTHCLNHIAHLELLLSVAGGELAKYRHQYTPGEIEALEHFNKASQQSDRD